VGIFKHAKSNIWNFALIPSLAFRRETRRSEKFQFLCGAGFLLWESIGCYEEDISVTPALQVLLVEYSIQALIERRERYLELDVPLSEFYFLHLGALITNFK